MLIDESQLVQKIGQVLPRLTVSRTNSNEVAGWKFRSPDDKQTVLAMFNTDMQIIDAKMDRLPGLVIVSSIGSAVIAGISHGTIMSLLELAGTTLAVSALGLAFFTGAGILTLGTLGVLLWQDSQVKTATKKVARVYTDLNNLELIGAPPTSNTDDKKKLF